VFVVFFMVVAGIIQFGLILWSINTVTQVARDTARWAATQSMSPCDDTGGVNRASLAATAGQLAVQMQLVGYRAGTWTTAVPMDSVGPEGVGADWPNPDPSYLFASDCPPADNQTPWMVRVRVNHVVPIFFPGLQFVAPPCGASGFCIASTAELRMEPKAP